MQTELDNGDVKHSVPWWERPWGIRDWALFLGGLAILFFVYISWDLYSLSNAAPPHSNCSLSEFSKTMPPPKQLLVVNNDDERRLVWIAERHPVIVRSGPTYYVFDSEGTLIDWVGESGEGAELDGLLYQAYETGESITLNEALDKFLKRQDRG